MLTLQAVTECWSLVCMHLCRLWFQLHPGSRKWMDKQVLGALMKFVRLDILLVSVLGKQVFRGISETSKSTSRSWRLFKRYGYHYRAQAQNSEWWESSTDREERKRKGSVDAHDWKRKQGRRCTQWRELKVNKQLSLLTLNNRTISLTVLYRAICACSLSPATKLPQMLWRMPSITWPSIL